MNKFTAFGRGRQRKPGEMNKTEARYEQHLVLLKHAGLISWFAYEPINLKLADGTYYKPDFMVMMADGLIECHEVKGGTRKRNAAGDAVSKPFIHDSKSTVKIKFAAERFPFIFRLVWPDKDAWHSQDY